jgi:hypothetical protein
MLEFDSKLWNSDKILKIFSKNDWTSNDTDIILSCTLNHMKELIEICIKNKERCILIFDVTKGELPSFYYITKIARYLYGINNLLSQGLNFSVVLGTKERLGFFLPTILKLYKPTRPLHIANTKNELKKLLIENKNECEC